VTRPYRKNGLAPLSTFLQTYKRGDIVDIKVNSSQHKGMPYKHYNGRTGVIFNVTSTAVGVIVKKIVREKQLQKKVLVKLEHVRMSSAREEIINRTLENEAHKKAVRAGKAST
jgi:large subunit ribosomal protein L21e